MFAPCKKIFLIRITSLSSSDMGHWNFVRAILYSVWLFFLAFLTSYVTAEPTITTRLLRGERNTLTLTCETKIKPQRNIVQLENGTHISAVNASGITIFTSQDVTHVKVTESSGLRQVNTEVTKWGEDTVFTCSTLISVTNGTFLSKYSRKAPMTNQTYVEATEDPRVELSPEYVVFSENARLYGSVEFMCVSNFISVDTETFRWSLTSTSTGKEFLDDELVGISNTGLFIEIDSSPTVSTFQLKGLNFPTVPDDFVVTCSARLNADASYVSASSTVQVTNQSTLSRRRVIIIFLGCATCAFFAMFVVATIVIFVMRKKKRGPDDPAAASPSSSQMQGSRPRPRSSVQSHASVPKPPPRDASLRSNKPVSNPSFYDKAANTAEAYANVEF